MKHFNGDLRRLNTGAWNYYTEGFVPPLYRLKTAFPLKASGLMGWISLPIELLPFIPNGRGRLTHMARKIDEYRVAYSDHQGTPHEAIQLPWAVVRDILGRNHDGSGEDDARLIEALREMGAPEWIDDAEGWIDEYGWGLVGPEQEQRTSRSLSE